MNYRMLGEDNRESAPLSADQVRALLAKASTPGERAALYVGVAAGLRDLADKAEPAKR